jgi:hypothetical protein
MTSRLLVLQIENIPEDWPTMEAGLQGLRPLDAGPYGNPESSSLKYNGTTTPRPAEASSGFLRKGPCFTSSLPLQIKKPPEGREAPEATPQGLHRPDRQPSGSPASACAGKQGTQPPAAPETPPGACDTPDAPSFSAFLPVRMEEFPEEGEGSEFAQPGLQYDEEGLYVSPESGCADRGGTKARAHLKAHMGAPEPDGRSLSAEHPERTEKPPEEGEGSEAAQPGLQCHEGGLSVSPGSDCAERAGIEPRATLDTFLGALNHDGRSARADLPLRTEKPPEEWEESEAALPGLQYHEGGLTVGPEVGRAEREGTKPHAHLETHVGTPEPEGPSSSADLPLRTEKSPEEGEGEGSEADPRGLKRHQGGLTVSHESPCVEGDGREAVMHVEVAAQGSGHPHTGPSGSPESASVGRSDTEERATTLEDPVDASKNDASVFTNLPPLRVGAVPERAEKSEPEGLRRQEGRTSGSPESARVQTQGTRAGSAAKVGLTSAELDGHDGPPIECLPRLPAKKGPEEEGRSEAAPAGASAGLQQLNSAKHGSFQLGNAEEGKAVVLHGAGLGACADEQPRQSSARVASEK